MKIKNLKLNLTTATGSRLGDVCEELCYMAEKFGIPCQTEWQEYILCARPGDTSAHLLCDVDEQKLIKEELIRQREQRIDTQSHRAAIGSSPASP